MGSSSSKSYPPTIGYPLAAAAPITLDTSKASYSADYIENLTRKASDAAAESQKQMNALAQQAASALASSEYNAAVIKYLIIALGSIILLIGVVLAGIAAYDAIACQFNGRQILFNISGPCNTPAAPAGPTGPAPPTPPKTQSTAPSAVSSPRPLLQQWYYGSASGNLLSSMIDTTGAVNVPSSSAPLSSEGSGAYGIQWWMFIKDWNYGYGKEKVVLSRADPTNGAIENPKVTLAPTENNLRVSISLFPSDSSSSKTEPAPANDPSSKDDVFVCEVPNIPLQSWMSVSLTVFDRNLDIYINGNLVKSCFLPGVPKPAAGNIDVSKDGGFSGYMCGLNHYGKALVPSDAQAFYKAGTSCSGQSGSAGPSGSYSVKFGVYDTKGKEVKEYTF